MRIFRVFILVVTMGAFIAPSSAAPPSAGDAAKPSAAHPHASGWRFLESPNAAKASRDRAPARPYVSGGGQAWKTRLRR